MGRMLARTSRLARAQDHHEHREPVQHGDGRVGEELAIWRVKTTGQIDKRDKRILSLSYLILSYLDKRRTHLDYDATTATSHLRRGTSEEAEAPRHLTHHLLPHPSAFGASPRLGPSIALHSPYSTGTRGATCSRGRRCHTRACSQRSGPSRHCLVYVSCSIRSNCCVCLCCYSVCLTDRQTDLSVSVCLRDEIRREWRALETYP
jgi:hypothetical protein